DSRNRTRGRERCPAAADRQIYRSPAQGVRTIRADAAQCRSTPARCGPWRWANPFRSQTIAAWESLPSPSMRRQDTLDVQYQIPYIVGRRQWTRARMFSGDFLQQVANRRAVPGIAGECPAQLISDTTTFRVHMKLSALLFKSGKSTML